MRLSDLVAQLREEPLLADLTERQVRFMQGEGFVPPAGGTRSNPEYGDEHVEAIRRYERLRRIGFRPAAIKSILEGSGPTVVEVVPGVTLTINPQAVHQPADVIAEAVVSALNDILPRRAAAETKTKGEPTCS